MAEKGLGKASQVELSDPGLQDADWEQPGIGAKVPPVGGQLWKVAPFRRVERLAMAGRGPGPPLWCHAPPSFTVILGIRTYLWSSGILR